MSTSGPIALPAIEELDRLAAADFAAAVGLLFERAPRFLRRLAAGRPFGSYARMIERALEIALAMPEDEQTELIDAHPRLGAPPATVSALSYREQGYDREAASATAEQEWVAAELARLNATYEARFDFRFCLFVDGRSPRELLGVMEACLSADRESELRRALSDVVAIAGDRLRKLVQNEVPR